MIGNFRVSLVHRGSRLWQIPVSLLVLGSGAAFAEDVPEFPPIPAIVIPDFVGTEPAQQSFENALGDQLSEIDGLRIAPARCDDKGAMIPNLGMVLRDDEGITANLGDAGQYLIDNGGAGTAHIGNTQVIVEKDGSGTINRWGEDGTEGEQIIVEADGSGTYNAAHEQVILDGLGGGTWNSDRMGQVIIEKDGSGTWNGPLGQIINDGNGSGTWNGPNSQIINDGNGRGTIDGREVDMAPLPPVLPAGKFPLLTKFRIPVAPCGFVITLEDRILFDFDKSDLRPDAAEVIDALGDAFIEVHPKRLEIRGHTDGKGSVEYNQALSERRAETIEGALKYRNVASPMEAQGFGKTQPVAVNEINGKDNPAGRQLNRRVEIYVPN